MFLVTLLFACPPTVPTDSGDTTGDTGDTAVDTGDTADSGDSGDTGEAPATTAVVTTTSDDYASAVLATVDLATWTITDNLATIGTDNAVFTGGGSTWVLDRYGAGVRVYTNGTWDAPVHEFSTGDASNPQSVANCGGKVWVSTYGDAQLRSYDPTSYLLNGAVDLSALADSDGIPEAADLIVRDGSLFVALQQLDEANGWVANGGKIAQIDCATGAVVQSWDAAPDPSIHEWPGHSGFIVRTGVYYTADYSDILPDGGISLFDPANGPSSLVVSEVTLDQNITDVAMVDDHHGVILTQDHTSTYTAWCWDLNTTELTELFSTTSFLASVKAATGSTAWIVARPSWTDPSSSGGIVEVDAVACQAGAEVWHKDFTFSPNAVAFY